MENKNEVGDEEMCERDGRLSAIDRLCAIMHRLRAPGGCPWDAGQTHASLVPHLLEEVYEVVDTIRREDFEHFREELGDLLLQVVFHCELAEEAGHFDFEAVAGDIADKLVRRHPHVFGEAQAGDSEAVLRQWESIKEAEKGGKKGAYLDGVGKGLPALLRAAKIQKKVAKVGFDWPCAKGVIEKIREEVGEVEVLYDEERGEATDRRALGEEIGDVLFAVVNLARKEGMDPEQLLDGANVKFERRFAAMEEAMRADGHALGEVDLETMERYWRSGKVRG